MRTWIEIFDRYMQEVSYCSTIAACEAIRNAAQVFCERTRAWRQDLDPIMMVGRFTRYDFDITDEVQIIKVYSAKLDGCEIPILPEPRSGSACVVVTSPTEFELHPVQARGRRLVLNVALEPSNTASGMDSWVIDRYARTIAKGAKYEIFSQADKPFSNPDRALQLRTEFEQEVADAMGDIAKHYSTAPLRVKAQFM